MLENQRVNRAFPTTGEHAGSAAIAEEVRAIATAVRRIGRGRGASPETILIEKHTAADRLIALAAQVEGAGW